MSARRTSAQSRRRHRGDEEVHELRQPPVHPADLEEGEEDGRRPGPEDPADPEARPGHAGRAPRARSRPSRSCSVPAPPGQPASPRSSGARPTAPRSPPGRRGSSSRSALRTRRWRRRAPCPGPAARGRATRSAAAPPRPRPAARRGRPALKRGPRGSAARRARARRGRPRRPPRARTPRGWMMPVPVERTVPVRISFERSEPAHELLEAALHLAGRRLAREDLAPAAQDAAAQGDRVGVGDLVGGDDHRPEREAARVDLRLRQVERVVALDVPGRDVVGEGEAEDGAAAGRGRSRSPARRR